MNALTIDQIKSSGNILVEPELVLELVEETLTENNVELYANLLREHLTNSPEDNATSDNSEESIKNDEKIIMDYILNVNGIQSVIGKALMDHAHADMKNITGYIRNGLLNDERMKNLKNFDFLLESALLFFLSMGYRQTGIFNYECFAVLNRGYEVLDDTSARERIFSIILKLAPLAN